MYDQVLAYWASMHRGLQGKLDRFEFAPTGGSSSSISHWYAIVPCCWVFMYPVPPFLLRPLHVESAVTVKCQHSFNIDALEVTISRMRCPLRPRGDKDQSPHITVDLDMATRIGKTL